MRIEGLMRDVIEDRTDGKRLKGRKRKRVMCDIIDIMDSLGRKRTMRALNNLCTARFYEVDANRLAVMLTNFNYKIYYSRTPLIRPPSESHWCGRIRGMVAREGFVYKQNAQSVTRNVVVWEGWSLLRVVVRQGLISTVVIISGGSRNVRKGGRRSGPTFSSWGFGGGRCKPPKGVWGRAPEANAFWQQSIENWLKIRYLDRRLHP